MTVKTRRTGKRILSLFLTIVMVFSMMVPVAHAEGEDIKFKNMMMQVLWNMDYVSHYDYASKDNTGYKPFCFNQSNT